MGTALSWLPTLAHPSKMQQLHDVAPAMLEEWPITKRAPNHAAWLHEKLMHAVRVIA